MTHLKSTALAAAALLLALESRAQVRQPAPTGQVPKSYTGVQQPAATGAYKPQPTGQIAPEAPGQLGTIVQPAPAAAPMQKSTDVQDLGFEVNSRPSTQQGAVPKVTTSQDPRTMPERYQPQVVEQTTTTTTEQVQVMPANGAQPTPSYPAATGTATMPAQSNMPATSRQPMPQNGRAVSQPAQPTTGQAGQPATGQPTSAPKAASQRVD